MNVASPRLNSEGSLGPVTEAAESHSQTIATVANASIVITGDSVRATGSAGESSRTRASGTRSRSPRTARGDHRPDCSLGPGRRRTPMRAEKHSPAGRVDVVEVERRPACVPPPPQEARVRRPADEGLRFSEEIRQERYEVIGMPCAALSPCFIRRSAGAARSNSRSAHVGQ